MTTFISILAVLAGGYWVIDSFSLIRKGSHRIPMPILFSRNTDLAIERQFNNEFLFGLILLALGLFIFTTTTINPLQKTLFLVLVYGLIDLKGASAKHLTH